MKIEKAFAVPVRGGYFNDDLAALQRGPPRDGFIYDGHPVTPGFERIRQPSEAISILLLLDNGDVVAGDGMSVEFSGAGGRWGRFRVEEQLKCLGPLLEYLKGLLIGDFLPISRELEKQNFGKQFHRPAIFYAVSQALLQAVAIDQGKVGAQILATELGVKVSPHILPINVQCGDDRYDNVDKAILKQVDAFPHGLVNTVEILGQQGEGLAEYVSWIVSRIQKYGHKGYNPEIHIDVYGLVGQIFDHKVDRMGGYLADLGERAAPYRFCVETPFLMESRRAQIDLFSALRQALRAQGSPVQLIADEWANDILDLRAFIEAEATDMINVKAPDLGCISNAAAAVLECWAGGVRPILGGSCTETDQSARVICQVGLATRPAWILARPGMGVDEGLQIVHNEMVRTLAVINNGAGLIPPETEDRIGQKLGTTGRLSTADAPS